ncbi:hypothetical protein [Flavobacterium sp.]|uniref:hypothetical protein n=1 Tax=Flavobacterium sp. TaxID=239 RepID=UPI0025EFE5B6|nr:hypothetical protein [Flavobacterium sp.]
MAQLDRSKSITGAIGNIVFKKIGNKQILQSKPDSVKQTKSTKAAGSEFRQCSLWGQRLRHGLRSFLAGEEGGYMHSRLNGQLYAAIQMNTVLPKGERTPLNSDMSTLAGFEFNTHSPFMDYFALPIEAMLDEQRQVVVTVPEFDPRTALQFAQNTKQAELLIYVLATNFDNNTGFPDDYTLIPIPNNFAVVPQTLWTSKPIPEGYLLLVCAKLQFYNTTRFTEKHYVNSKECCPMRVVMVG